MYSKTNPNPYVSDMSITGKMMRIVFVWSLMAYAVSTAAYALLAHKILFIPPAPIFFSWIVSAMLLQEKRWHGNFSYMTITIITVLVFVLMLKLEGWS